MRERTRRYPRRPALFWVVFGLVAVLSVSATGLLWVKAQPEVHTR